jgi:hypothetical protein
MLRRKFLAGAGATLLMDRLIAAPKGAILELRHYSMRNNADQQMQRTTEFIEKHAIPASKRAGLGPTAVFGNLIAPSGPFVLMINTYRSLGAMEEAGEKLAEDKEFARALEGLYAMPGLPYQRVDTTLLRCPDWMPTLEVPPARKTPRVFELRTYESNTPATLRKKVKMFGDGEMGIFRRLGMAPVFFGTAVAGGNQPHLSYMLGYDSLAERERLWQAFLADPEWAKMRVTPGLSDAEVVSNISSVLLRPLPFSAVK